MGKVPKRTKRKDKPRPGNPPVSKPPVYWPLTSTPAKEFAIQIGAALVVYFLVSAKMRAYIGKGIVIEMGGVSRYFSKVSESGVDATLLNERFRGHHFRGHFREHWESSWVLGFI